jgi:hypothetical protein
MGKKLFKIIIVATLVNLIILNLITHFREIVSDFRYIKYYFGYTFPLTFVITIIGVIVYHLFLRFLINKTAFLQKVLFRIVFGVVISVFCLVVFAFLDKIYSGYPASELRLRDLWVSIVFGFLTSFIYNFYIKTCEIKN